MPALTRPDPSPHPPWFEPGPPPAERAVIPRVLAANAAALPDAPCVRFDDGGAWSRAETWAEARAAAAALGALGVRQGERVLVWLPNGAPLLRVWFGLNTLGAVLVPLNVAYRGAVLEHVIRLSGARLMIAHAELVGHLAGIDTGGLARVVVCGPLPEARAGMPALLDAAVLEAEAPLPPLPVLEPWDTAAILLTSGTTGPSKGVINPYGQLYTAGMASHGHLRPNDRLYLFTPLFHTLGLLAVFAVLARGASFHLAESFRAQTFWQDVRACGCNRILGLISTMASYLAGSVAPGGACPFDFTMMQPITAETRDFARRMGFEYYSAYSMTEVSVPLVSQINEPRSGTTGRPRSGIECRLVDEHDIEVPDGSVGELILRAEHPWTLSTGYLDDPQATLAAWRNGWFHTGDAFRRDEDGNYAFVDRLKDAIRRRGENISSYEVEREVASFPGVREVAVIGAPDGHGGQEVLAVLVADDPDRFDPAALLDHLLARLAHFAIPRYVRLVEALPRTPTNKIRKDELRAAGITSDAWDRERHGIAIRRARLTPASPA